MHLLTRAALMTGLAAFHLPSGAKEAAVGGDPWRFVHPQAKWILGIDWARARTSAGAQVLSRHFAGVRGKVESSGLGFSAIVSLDRIVASGMSMEARGKDSPEGLVVAIEGKLDRLRLKKELPPGTAIEKFRGADLYVPPKARESEPLVAVVGNTLLLIGDRESPGPILAGNGGARDPDLFGRAARLAGEAELWMVASAAGTPQPEVHGQGGPLRDLQSMELAVSLGDGLRMRASVDTSNAESARNLAGLLQLVGATGGSDTASAWLRQMHVELKGNVLHLSLLIPAADLDRGIEAGKAAVQQTGRQALESWLDGGRGSLSATLADSIRARVAGQGEAARLPTPPSQPKVRTIRITGAESGPAEIHYIAPR